MLYCHSRTVYHSDLKPSNILVCYDKENKIEFKLADFGLATRDFASHWRGTPAYMSAEMQINYDNKGQPNPVLKDCFNEANDIWALGMIGYQLLCMKKPYDRATFEFDEDNNAWKGLSTAGKAWFAQIFPKNYFNAHSRQC